MPRAQRPASRVQGPAPRAQHPASRVQRPESSIESSASRVQSSTSSVQSPTSNSCVQSPGILVCQNLTTLRKARENICEQSSHGFLNVVKFNQLLSWQHAVPHKILQFWAIFEPRYLRNTSYKWIDFLDFTQIIQNGSTGEWKYDETFFTTVQSIRIVSLKCAEHLLVN